MHAGRPIAACALAAVVAGGCLFDASVPYAPGDLPAIACHDDDRCPPDWVCRGAIGRCVPAELLNSAAPPALDGAAVVEPATAKIGARVVARFSIATALAAPPEVAIELPGRAPRFSPSTPAEGAYGYEYEYVVDGSEAQGTHDVVAHVVDGLGQTATLALGVVTLDFAAPVLEAAELSPGFASDGERVGLALTFDEPLAAAPLVELVGDGGALAVPFSLTSAADDQTTFQLERVVGTVDAEGTFALRVAVVDVAGNAATLVPSATLAVDFTAPSLSGAAQITPGTLLRPGEVLRVSARLSEVLSATPALGAQPSPGAVGALAFDRTTDAGDLQAFTAVVPAGAEGDFALELASLVDLAGNAAPLLSLGTVTIDGTAPAVVDYQQSTTAAQPGAVVAVSFATSEQLAQDPVLTFGGVAFAPTELDAGGRWRFDVDVAATSVDGLYPVQLELKDAAGNLGLESPAGLLVDTAAPHVLAVTFAPSSVRLGAEALAIITVDEPLGEPPALAWSLATGGPGPETYEGASGLGYLFSWTIDSSSPTGALALESVEIVDVAGNRATVVLADALGAAPLLLVDNIAPTVTPPLPLAAAYSAQPGFDIVTVAFDVVDDEDIAAPPAVTLGGRAMSCGAYQQSSPNFTCSYAVQGDEPEGALPVLASFVDGAGNVGFASSSVALDFTAPDVVPGTEFLAIVPGPQNPHLAPTTATAGSIARVGFRADEPLDEGAQPEVFATDPAALAFDVTSLGGGTWLAQHEIVAGTTAGDYAVYVRLVDGVGNDGVRELALPPPGLRVDVTAPAPPLVDVAGAVRLSRVPWGSRATGGEVALVVEAEAAALPGASVAVFHTAAAPPRAELGRAVVRSDGGLDPVALLPTNTAAVFVVSLDEAGNESAPMRIRDVEWIATLGGKQATSTAVNPHVLEARPVHVRQGANVIAPEESGVGLVAPLGQGSVRLAGAGRWRAPNAISPFGVADTAAAYDSLRGRVVMHGGYTYDNRVFTGVVDETWEFADGRWHKLAPLDPEGDGEPGPLCGHVMTYDARRGVTVLFGGLGACYDENTFADTWELDGTSWRLRSSLADPEGDGEPPARGWASMTFDEAHGVALLYGGRPLGGGAGFADLWAYDGSSWALLVDETESLASGPGERMGAVLAYDPASETSLLFGGAADDEVWRWDGALWSTVAASDPEGDGAPTGNAASDAPHGLDRGRDRLVVVAAGEVWEWLGSSWERRALAAGAALETSAAPSVWNAADDELFVFSGYTQSTPESRPYLDVDVPWGWDGVSWRPRALCCPAGQTLPPPRFESRLIANPSSGELMLLGSAYGYGVDVEPWTLLDGRFEQRPLDDASADGEVDAWYTNAALWDPTTASAVTFEGSTHWRYDGLEWHPTPVTDPEVDGPTTVPAVFGWDPTRAAIVGFRPPAGARWNVPKPLDSAWVFNGASWTSLPVDDPENDGHPQIYTDYWSDARVEVDWLHDPISDRLLYFDPWSWTDDTVDVWEWTGSSWRRLPIDDPEGDGNPETRYYSRVGFDPTTGYVVIYGGFGKDGTRNILSDMWRWTGTSWQRQRVADPEGDGGPGRNAVGALGVDPGTNELVLYGGQNGVTDEHGDVWLWDSGVGERPAYVLHVATGDAGIDAGSALLGLDVHAFAAGRGHDDGGAAVDGAELLTWRAGTWTPVDVHAAVLGAPAALDASLDARATRETVRTWPGLPTLVAIAPVGKNGASYAEVELEYVEVRLRYRLPPSTP